MGATGGVAMMVHCWIGCRWDRALLVMDRCVMDRCVTTSA